jgi:hypothetical protein
MSIWEIFGAKTETARNCKWREKKLIAIGASDAIFNAVTSLNQRESASGTLKFFLTAKL